jgi:N-acetylneuraminate epimerase
MKIALPIIIILFMSSVGELFAQKKSVQDTWHIAGVLPSNNQQKEGLGLAGPITGISGNRLLVAGGANFPDGMPWKGGKKIFHNKVYSFKKRGQKLSLVTDEYQLPENIAYAASCSTPKGVLYAGGESEKGISDKVFLLKWDHYASAVIIESLPALPLAVSNASAISYNNIVYVLGGETQEGVSNMLWVIDLNDINAGWSQLPSMPKQISHGVFVAIKYSGILKLYMVGGRRKTSQGISELYNTVYEFNVLQQKWSELAPLPYPLSAGTGVATKNGNILLFGGDRGTTFSKVENYISLINKAPTQLEKEELILKKNQVLLSHPGFSQDILLYNIQTQSTKIAGLIPYATPVTTNAFYWGKEIVIPSGEIKAGVRTPQILMAKIPRL